MATIPIATNGAYGGQGISSHATFQSSGGFTGNLHVVSLAPAHIVTSTPIVSLTAQITNFDNIAACTITFRATYLAR